VRTSPIDDKRALRVRLKAALALLTPAQRSARSAAACGRALVNDLFPPNSTVMLYAPMVEQGEVDLRLLEDGLTRRGCRLCIARVDWETGAMTPALVDDLDADLVEDPKFPGRGLMRPREDARDIPAAEIDVVVVPGLGFDRMGRRIGRGAGFYDRFLAGLATGRTLRMALAFDEQIVDSVPVEEHDVGVQVVVTPTEIVRPAGA
jgi:5-formyltetrahydrofolate cyclo-ligase